MAGDMGSWENGPQMLQTGNFPSVLPGERDTVAMLPHLNQLHNSTSGALCGVSVNHTPYTMSYKYLALCPRESIAQ